MIKQVINLRIGDDLILAIAFTDDVTGETQSMAGWEVASTMSCDSCCSSIDLTFAWVDQITGSAELRLSKTQTATLEAGDYDLQIRTVSPEGDTQSAKPVTIRVRA